MATAIQRRRGTAQHSSFTGLAGETADPYNEQYSFLFNDGSNSRWTPGKISVKPLLMKVISLIVAGAGLTGDATSGDATLPQAQVTVLQ